MLLLCQISFIFILCWYYQGRWCAYRDLVFRSEMGKTKIDMDISIYRYPTWRNSDANAYIPIWIRGYEHVTSLVRWNRLYTNKKIYYPAYWASPPIAILFPYKHPARNKYVTLKTSFIQATHFQFCHNYLKSIRSEFQVRVEQMHIT